MPAIVIAAFLKPLNLASQQRAASRPDGPALSDYSGTATSAASYPWGASHRLSARAPHGEMQRNRPA
jgi:hypothetical protein